MKAHAKVQAIVPDGLDTLDLTLEFVGDRGKGIPGHAQRCGCCGCGGCGGCQGCSTQPETVGEEPGSAGASNFDLLVAPANP